MNKWMEHAIWVAQKSNSECPIGCIIVKNNIIIAEAHNEVEKYQNPLYHAEILCIYRALTHAKDKFLYDCTMYCTLEPCKMCAEAISLVRIPKLIFGAFQIKQAPKKNSISITGGILEDKCKNLLHEFFLTLR